MLMEKELALEEMIMIAGGKPVAMPVDVHNSYVQNVVRLKSAKESLESVLKNCMNKTDTKVYGEDVIRRYVKTIYMA